MLFYNIKLQISMTYDMLFSAEKTIDVERGFDHICSHPTFEILAIHNSRSISFCQVVRYFAYQTKIGHINMIHK